MFATPEQFAAANKASVEAMLTLANTALASAERIAALNLNTARAALENQFTAELLQDFCKQDYSLDLEKLVAFNSQNMQAE